MTKTLNGNYPELFILLVWHSKPLDHAVTPAVGKGEGGGRGGVAKEGEERYLSYKVCPTTDRFGIGRIPCMTGIFFISEEA